MEEVAVRGHERDETLLVRLAVPLNEPMHPNVGRPLDLVTLEVAENDNLVRLSCIDRGIHIVVREDRRAKKHVGLTRLKTGLPQEVTRVRRPGLVRTKLPNLGNDEIVHQPAHSATTTPGEIHAVLKRNEILWRQGIGRA